MGILFVWGKGNLDQIPIFCLHFEIVGQIQERMLALKLSWTVCLKLYRKGLCYYLSEEEVTGFLPSSLANWPTWNMDGGRDDHVNTFNWILMSWEVSYCQCSSAYAHVSSLFSLF